MGDIYEQFFAPDGDFGSTGCLLSSDDDDDDEKPGHPDQTKEDVLAGLRNGFKYHKNGPAREYNWSKAEIQQMSELIREKDKTVHSGSQRFTAVHKTVHSL